MGVDWLCLCAVHVQVAKKNAQAGLKPHLLPDFRIIGIIGLKVILLYIHVHEQVHVLVILLSRHKLKLDMW